MLGHGYGTGLFLSWLALALTPGLASRLPGRLLKEFGSLEEVFRAPLPRLERSKFPAAVAQAVFKKQVFKRGEGTGFDSRDRELQVGQLDGPGISADLVAGLRSARAAVRSGRRAGSETS
jgi:hypothetical protein